MCVPEQAFSNEANLLYLLMAFLQLYTYKYTMLAVYIFEAGNTLVLIFEIVKLLLLFILVQDIWFL